MRVHAKTQRERKYPPLAGVARSAGGGQDKTQCNDLCLTNVKTQKRMRKATLSLAICLLLLACKKDDSEDQKPWTCVDYSQTLDSSVIADKILGTWHFVKERGGSNGEVLMADKNIQVTFEPNFTFTVVENSSVITQGDWRLKKFFDIPKEWELDVSSPSRYLRGRIVFCDNQLVFSYSALDGNDKLFKRKDK
jgi:hypothetical protein